jgi:hypothetical protein
MSESNPFKRGVAKVTAQPSAPASTVPPATVQDTKPKATQKTTQRPPQKPASKPKQTKGSISAELLATRIVGLKYADLPPAGFKVLVKVITRNHNIDTSIMGFVIEQIKALVKEGYSL